MQKLKTLEEVSNERNIPQKTLRHHIKPKYASKFDGEPIDDSYENGSLCCVECHRYIHLYSWWSREYHQLMSIVLSNKNMPTS